MTNTQPLWDIISSFQVSINKPGLLLVDNRVLVSEATNKIEELEKEVEKLKLTNNSMCRITNSQLCHICLTFENIIEESCLLPQRQTNKQLTS